MSASLKRPKALSDFIAQLDQAGWSYSVNHLADSEGCRFVKVAGAPLWDPYAGVQATWHSRDTGTLRMTSCVARQEYHNWFDLSLKAARELIVPEPAEVLDAK